MSDVQTGEVYSDKFQLGNANGKKTHSTIPRLTPMTYGMRLVRLKNYIATILTKIWSQYSNMGGYMGRTTI